ncbi:putative ribonuclease H-like domain-containing protein [Tanacetum coccineum]|uniref:Ribonuclease H-like domain-containing protein n=1 Tax=Tanacetum coccineum TaxID=301880 RepID=A0ABQ5ET76_9ASTR
MIVDVLGIEQGNKDIPSDYQDIEWRFCWPLSEVLEVNVVPSRDLTCLFSKATIDESKLWHRRLGHVKFKTMNKLVKGNLVRGLPSKIFENDHTRVACQKGKQHKASCMAKLVSSIHQPLQMLHMDLFGPTFVRSINHKTYFLVVTDDFSRCDNGTEFKNREINEFCGLKGIKREFSVARTPQQNRVDVRKNKTLIEAARTMLADSLLPTVFWAEAVNTACYVLNRVLVTKPHNKTPYELIIGRPPSISFMRPFGCPVTILNTLDPLGKFDGKAKEGFLVGYSVNSKAFRVFNSQTRKVEENLHVNFLENKPNVVGQGPNWLFDIDSLTNSMNYQPVTAGNQTNKNAGPQEANGNTGLKQSVDAGQSEEKNVSTQQYIVFLLWSSISSSYKSSDENDTADDSAGESPIQKPASENEQALKNVLDKMMDQEKEATEQSDAVRKEFEAQCNRELLQGKATKASSTNSFNTVSTPVNAASAPRTSNDAGPSFVPLGGSFPLNVNDLPDDPLMPDLEDTAEVQNTGIFGSAFDDEDLDTYNSPFADQVMGAEADFNNMEPSTVVSPIPTTRVHSIHPKDQIIGDPKSAQEPTKITQALDDESWVEAMQEELLQFKIQKVWTLVDLPYGKKAIGTKWVYRNKKDERDGCQKCLSLGTIEEEIFEQKMHKRFQKIQWERGSHLLGFYKPSRKSTLDLKSDARLWNTDFIKTRYSRIDHGETTAMPNVDIPRGIDTGGSPRRQDTMGGAPAQTRSERVLEQLIEPPLSEGHTSGSKEGRMEHQFELTINVPITPYDSPLPGGYTPRSDEGRLQLQELMTMCTKLSKQVLDLKKKKDAQAVEILKLKKGVKGLERQRKSSTSQPRRRKYRQVESLDDDLNEEDASK